MSVDALGSNYLLRIQLPSLSPTSNTSSFRSTPGVLIQTATRPGQMGRGPSPYSEAMDMAQSPHHGRSLVIDRSVIKIRTAAADILDLQDRIETTKGKTVGTNQLLGSTMKL